MINDALFEFHRITVISLFVERVKEREPISDLVGIIVDPSAEVHDTLRVALDIEHASAKPLRDVYNAAPASGEEVVATNMPLPGVYNPLPKAELRIGTLYRQPLVDLLRDTHPEVSVALESPTRLGRVPCVVLTTEGLTLHRFAAQPLAWVPGGRC